MLLCLSANQHRNHQAITTSVHFYYWLTMCSHCVTIEKEFPYKIKRRWHCDGKHSPCKCVCSLLSSPSRLLLVPLTWQRWRRCGSSRRWTCPSGWVAPARQTPPSQWLWGQHGGLPSWWSERAEGMISWFMLVPLHRGGRAAATEQTPGFTAVPKDTSAGQCWNLASDHLIVFHWDAIKLWVYRDVKQHR